MASCTRRPNFFTRLPAVRGYIKPKLIRMPVAQKHDTIPEDETLHTTVPIPSPLDPKLFEDITETLDKIRQARFEVNENEKKIEKLTSCIAAADEMIEKAQSARDLLAKKRSNVLQSLNIKDQRKREALEYWNNFYGLDVRQLSKDNDDFELYEFIYTRLPAKRLGDQGPDPAQPSAATQELNNTNETTRCSIELKLHQRKFELVAQNPVLLSADTLTQLSSRLSSECIHPETGQADYRQAMKLIKKELVKVLDP